MYMIDAYSNRLSGRTFRLLLMAREARGLHPSSHFELSRAKSFVILGGGRSTLPLAHRGP